MWKVCSVFIHLLHGGLVVMLITNFLHEQMLKYTRHLQLTIFKGTSLLEKEVEQLAHWLLWDLNSGDLEQRIFAHSLIAAWFLQNRYFSHLRCGIWSVRAAISCLVFYRLGKISGPKAWWGNYTRTRVLLHKMLRSFLSSIGLEWNFDF